MIFKVFKFLEVRGWESGEGGILPDFVVSLVFIM